MKRTALPFMTAVAMWLCITTGLSAQAPSFAGRWTTDPDPAAVSAAGGQPGAAGQRRGGGGARGRGDMGSGWGSTITITQDEARLVVEYAFFTRGDMQPPLRFSYALDGSETRNTVMMGQGMQLQTSKTAWSVGTLVITTVHTFRDPGSGKPITTEVKQALTLESPTSLVVETTRAGVLGGPATTTKTVYRKL